jgi:hypothetical protein
MKNADKAIHLCSCNGTVPIDIKRLADALQLDAPLDVGAQLCRRDAHAFSRLLGNAPEAIVGCTQESALLRDLADEAGGARAYPSSICATSAGRSARGSDVTACAGGASGDGRWPSRRRCRPSATRRRGSC